MESVPRLSGMTCRASLFENVSLDEMSCVKTQKGKTRCLVSLVSHSSQAGRPGCKTHGPHLHTQNHTDRAKIVFPECVAKGSRFTLGVWFHNRSQHDHKWGPLAVPVECCKSGHFWRFQMSCNLVS